MALSKRSSKVMEASFADKKASAEVESMLNASLSSPAASIAVFGATANLAALVPAASALAAVVGTYANAAEPTGAEVDASINALGDLVDSALDSKSDNADVETLRGEVEARLDAIELKVNAVIAALKAAGLMLP